jgi:deltex-like protein
MDAATTSILEGAFAGGLATCQTVRGKWTYTIDLKSFTQTNDSTGAVRTIRRLNPSLGGGGGGGGGGGAGGSTRAWEVEVDGGAWLPFDAPIQALLDSASSSGQTSVAGIRVRGHTYTIDLVSNKQINTKTQKQRNIRQTPTPGQSQPQFASCTESGDTLTYNMGDGDVDYQGMTQWTVLTAGRDYDPATDCAIMCTPLGDGIAEPVVQLSCSTSQIPCIFQRSTIESCLASNPTCPTCRKQFAIPGAQPTGTMRVRLESRTRCEGFARSGTWHISYRFPNGVQHKRMVKPGTGYSGTSRDAYYPDTPEGREAVDLLKKAFRLGYLFVVNDSVTTGQTNTVVWAGIHQKTSLSGGATNHGWPDDSAFVRLKSECASRGIA